MEEQEDEKEKITFVMPKTVLDVMRRLAREHGRSFVGEIVWALRQYIQQHQKASDGKSGK